MNSVAWVLVLFGVLGQIHWIQAKRGYLFIAPKHVHPETNDTICIMFYDITGTDAKLNITLLDNSNNETITSQQFVISDVADSSWHCLPNFDVPSIDTYNGNLRLQVEFPGLEDDYSIDKTKEVLVSSSYNDGLITFIETDKDKYKAGQKIRFRILTMDSDMKPVTNTIPEVWIEDPDLNRVAQWKEVDMKKGLTQLSYTLTKEPPLGTWTIYATINDEQEAQRFEVAEYVLPKYTLTITPRRESGAIYNTENNYTWTVCAKYTHGQPVSGTMNVTYHHEIHTYRWRAEDTVVPQPSEEVIFEEKEFSGCEEITLTNETLGLSPDTDKVKLNVAVEEEGTGVIKNELAESYYSINYFFFEEQHADAYFFPGLYYNGEMTLRDSENAEQPDTKVELCVTYLRNESKRCQEVVTDVDGSIRYQIQPIEQVEFNKTSKGLKIEFKLTDSEDNYRHTYATSWYSDSYSFIKLEGPEDKETLECDREYQMRLTYTPPEQEVTASVVIQSAGRIVSTSSIDLSPSDPVLTPDEEAIHVTLTDESPSPPVLFKTFPIKTHPNMSEMFNILVHYTLEAGEVIATGKSFNVETCLKHKVEVSWNKEKPAPGDDIELSLKGELGSVCGLSVVDRSVKLLGSSNQLKQGDLGTGRSWLHLTEYSSPQQKRDWVYCSEKENESTESTRTKRSIYEPFVTSVADAISAFDISGFIVMTDLLLETRPCEDAYILKSGVHYVLDDAPPPAAAPRPAAPLPPAAPRPAAPPPGPPAAPETPGFSNGGNGNNGISRGGTQTPSRIRQYFPETWLFELEYLEEDKAVTKEMKVPDTITEWVGSGYCLSPDSGLGISPEASFVAFTPFFLDYNLPYSVKRGETFELKISVFNYIDQEAPVTLSLKESDKYKSEDGVYEKKVTVPPNKSQVLKLDVTATKIGDVNITSLAFIAPEDQKDGNLTFTSDAIKKKIKVEAEGFPQEEHQIEFVCVNDEEKVRLLNCSPPEDIVADSSRSTYSVTGDLMGPILTNLDSFIRFPTGCGEQNMAKLVPNIHALTYLDSVNIEEPELRKKSIEHMAEGYQRQLKYKHGDGSYSAFGGRDNSGSIWLTAFVLKSFSQAKPYTFIDEKIVDEAKGFILEHQQSDGCFEKVGEVYSSALKGGHSNTNTTKVLTAYIIVALIEAGMNPGSEPIKNALKCINEMPDKPYAQAMAAYAWHLADKKHTDRKDQEFFDLQPYQTGENFLAKLQASAKKEGQLMWWEQEGGCTYCGDMNVEVAGYALMAFLLSSSDNWETNRPIARYLISQRNGHGGFYSTQDTVVGLEALTKYATLAEEVPLESVTVQSQDDAPAISYTVNKENRLLTTEIEAGEKVTTDITIEGKGCVIAQCSIKYNIPTPQSSTAFELDVSSSAADEPATCKTSELRVCAKYVLDDGESNMAVIEVNMASGYTYDFSSLDYLLNDVELNLKRYDTEEDKVNLYFDSFDNTLKCFTLILEQDTVVKDPKPANVNIYDYYQTELKASKSYSVCKGEAKAMAEEVPETTTSTDV